MAKENKKAKSLCIQKFRSKRNWTASDLANYSGIPFRSIQKYEYIKPTAESISYKTILIFSIVFNTDMESLFEYIND